MTNLEQVKAAARQMRAMGFAPVNEGGRKYYLLTRGDVESHPLDGVLAVIDMPYREEDHGDVIISHGIKGQGFVIPYEWAK